MQNKTAQWASGLGIGLLAAAAFAGGLHLRPSHAAGHDLVQAQVLAQSTGAARGLTLTGLSGGRKVAQFSPDNAATPAIGAALDGAVTDSETSPAATFGDVYALLRRNYVEGVPDDSKMSHGAVAAMLSSLQDPATRFLEPAEFAEARRESQGQFAGIGAVLDVRTTVTPKPADDPTRDKNHPANTVYALTVVTPVPGSPAERAGLRSGDVITDINGQWVATYDLVSAQAKALKAAQDRNDPVALNKMVQALQKKLDNGVTLPQAETKLRDALAVKPLVLTVSRPGVAAPMTITVTPGKTVGSPDTEGRNLANNNAYIKVSMLTARSGDSMTQALTGLGAAVSGVILDLRNTTGGTPEDAAAVASKLTTATTLGLRIGKSLKPSDIPIVPARAVAGPVVVLINGGTEGAAELLASALKAGGAKLIGSPTFGDDKDVRTVALPDGSGFTMTVGRLLTASGGQFGGAGIVPDIAVPGGGNADDAYNRAVTELSGRVAHR